MRENCSVRCEQEGCSRQVQGSLNRERPVTKPLSFHLAQERVFSSELEWRVQGVYTERHNDRYGGMVASEKTNKNSYLKNNPVFDWQPVKFLEQWSNMLMSALAKNNLHCMVLNFLQPVHLITVDVNEQRVAEVQLTKNT